VVTLASLLIGWRAKFDYNVLNLQSKNLPAVETEMRLLNADAESTIFAAIVCNTLDETRMVQNTLTGLASVASVHSIAEMIPEDQEAKVPIIQGIQKELGDIHFVIPPSDPADIDSLSHALGTMRLRADKLLREANERKDQASLHVLEPLTVALKTARTRVQQLDPAIASKQMADYERQFYGDLEGQLRLMTTQSEHPMTVADVPATLRKMLVGRTGKFLVRVFPKKNIWERPPLEEFVRQVKAVAPQVTGTPLGLYEFVEVLQIGYIKAALWAFLVIAIIILVDFRGLLATVFTLLPLTTGLVWMVGAMGVLGISFNPANIMTLPLMVGIGVAYGIYVVQRYRQEGETTFYSKSTGRAVVLSAMTTISAFACLIFGSHQGIRSLGLVMTIGVSACLCSGMLLLPACLQIAKEKGWKI
jgi:predicted RND superfamily exporter protein